MGREARPIVFEDLKAVANIMNAKQVLAILSEEQVNALGGEVDGAVAADLAEGSLGVGEGQDEEEVDHFRN